MTTALDTPSASASSKPSDPTVHPYPFWSPRFWHGMRLGDWFTLLRRNHFRVHPSRWAMAGVVTIFASVNSVLSACQWLRFDRAIRATKITEPPLFIVGHWRSGTTFLHELMVRDDRFAYPTTYECMAPHHFITTSWIVPSLMWWLLPAKRPMDNMATGFSHPQEEELALAVLGAPTPYARMAFPNNPPPWQEFLDLENVDPKDLQRFRDALYWFAQAETYFKKKRLIMKSPPHLGRVGLLAEMFPGAKFVHIHRDPYTLYSSTHRLWRALDPTQSFQAPRHDREPERYEEFIFTCFERLYGGFEKQRARLAPGQLLDLRYDDLIRRPLEELRNVYEKLELGEFEYVRPKIEQHLESQKDYRAARHALEPRLKEKIDQRWGAYARKYGYA